LIYYLVVGIELEVHCFHHTAEFPYIGLYLIGCLVFIHFHWFFYSEWI